MSTPVPLPPPLPEPEPESMADAIVIAHPKDLEYPPQPPKSTAVLSKDDNGVTLTIPPALVHTGFVIVLVVATLWVIGSGVLLVLNFVGSVKLPPLVDLLLFSLGAGAAGVAGVSFWHGLTRTTIRVSLDTLQISRKGLLTGDDKTWPRSAIADVRKEGKNLWVYDVRGLRVAEIMALSKAEELWTCAVLRRALGFDPPA